MSHHFRYEPPPDDSGTWEKKKKSDRWTLKFKHGQKDGATITLIVPKKGVFESATLPDELGKEQADLLGPPIADVLRTVLVRSR